MSTSNFITFDSNVFAFGKSTLQQSVGFQYDITSNRLFGGIVSSGAMSTTVFTFGDKFYIGSNAYSLPLEDGVSTNVLATDGTGTVSWVEASSGPTGPTGEIGPTGDAGPTGPDMSYSTWIFDDDYTTGDPAPGVFFEDKSGSNITLTISPNAIAGAGQSWLNVLSALVTSVGSSIALTQGALVQIIRVTSVTLASPNIVTGVIVADATFSSTPAAVVFSYLTVPVAGAGTGSILLRNGDDSNLYYNSTLQVLGPTGHVQVAGDLLPAADLTYNLGSTGLQWHSLFVGTGSIHVGGATIGASGTSLVINGDIVPANSNSANFGSPTKPWKEMYIGPGSLNIAGPGGISASLGSDQNSIVYTESGFATPFINIGPSIDSNLDPGAIGGWVIGPTGTYGSNDYDLIAQQKTTGSAVPAGLTGPIFSLINRQGSTGSTGPTGPTGPAGQNGVSGGYVLFLDTATATSPITNGTLLATPNTGAITTITTPSTTNTNNYLTATFTSAADSLTTTTIVGGLWDLNIYTVASSVGGASFYFAAYYVDSDGTSNPVLLATGSSAAAQFIDHTTATLSETSLYVPNTTIPDITKRIQIKLFTNFIGNNKIVTYSFRNVTPSHLHTTLLTNTPTGPTGPTGIFDPSQTLSTLTVSTINSAPYMWSQIGTGSFSNAEHPISFILPYTTGYAVQITPSAYTSSSWYAYFSTLSTFTVGGGDESVAFQWTTIGY